MTLPVHRSIVTALLSSFFVAMLLEGCGDMVERYRRVQSNVLIRSVPISAWIIGFYLLGSLKENKSAFSPVAHLYDFT